MSETPESAAARPSHGHGLRRDVDLLEALATPEAQERGGLGVVRLAAIVGRDKGQVSRSLRALAEQGILERDPDTLEYRLGWRLFSLVARSSESRLLRVAEPVMHRLAAYLEETTHLCVLRDSEVLTLLSISWHSFRVHGWEGRGFSAASTSAGRVLLMDSSPDELYVRLGGVDLSDGFEHSSVHSIQELWARIEEARRAGYAMVSEEFEDELVGVSAPIRDYRGRVLAALNVSAPLDRLGGDLPAAGRAAAQAAEAISTQLGWQPRPGGGETARARVVR
jgi:DNA-binding IclR family transcriptional regulator